MIERTGLYLVRFLLRIPEKENSVAKNDLIKKLV